MLYAIGVMPVGGDSKFRRRAVSKEYGLIEALAGLQTLEWFLILYIRVGSFFACGSHVRHDRGAYVCDTNVMILESNQHVAGFDL